VKDAEGIAPVGITQDIWFYPCPENFEFVVWTDAGLVRKAIQFRISRRALSKFLTPLKPPKKKKK
jgi:hypothetical protein